MLDINEIKNNFDSFKKGLDERKVSNSNTLLNSVISLDNSRKKNKTELDKILNEINILSKKVGKLFKLNKISEANALKPQIVELKEKSKKFSTSLDQATKQIEQILFELPNIPYKLVPSESEGNAIISKSPMPNFEKNLHPHWELLKKYDLIDFELGNKITGAGFPVYKNKMAKLQRSLVSFFLDNAINEGYKEVQIPILVNENSVYATGQLPDKEGLMYKIENENLYLIPTAEVPITNIFRNTVLDIDDLPIKYVGYSPNFRKEAGSWGSDVRGLNRLHQFEKVEIVQIIKPEDSYDALENMCQYIEGLLVKLELPYRKLRLSVDDLGFASAMTYDLEVYSAGQDKWLEVSSISNFESFQSTRLKLRYRDKKNIKNKPHTLNGSAIAFPRIIAALIENNQVKNGIKIPEALVPYTKFEILN
ncbi:MAG: serine--tRNA ligase [Bacteroidetes bacterium]|nr:serine--tRNA ligase [Bacteroidota bacterium]